MKRLRENMIREIGNILDDVTVELEWIINMIEDDAKKEDVIEELKNLEEALA